MKSREPRRLFLLAWALLPVALVEGSSIAHSVQVLRYAPDTAKPPFSFRLATREIASGPFANHQLLAVNGKPFNRPKKFEEMIRSMHPGDQLLLLLSEPNGHAIERRVTLTALGEEIGPGSSVAFAWIILGIIFPAVALAIGALVVFRRADHGSAWLLLFLLAAVAEWGRARVIAGAQSEPSFLLTALCSTAAPLLLMFFGLRFSGRARVDRQHPALRYMVAFPFALASTLYWILAGLWLVNVNQTVAWRVVVLRLSAIQKGAFILALLVFFSSIFLKSRNSPSADARRRLRLAFTGSTLSVVPILSLALAGAATGRNLTEAGRAFPYALGFLLLFPVTLAYCIVVERARDPELLIREALRRLFNIGNSQPFNRTWQSMIWQCMDRRLFPEAYESERRLRYLATGERNGSGWTLDTLGLRLSASLGAADVTVIVRNGASFQTAWSSRDGEPLALPASNGISNLLAKEGRPLEVDFDPPSSWLYRLNSTELQAITAMRSRLLFAVPGAGAVAAILSAGVRDSDLPSSSTEIRLLQMIADRLGHALARPN